MDHTMRNKRSNPSQSNNQSVAEKTTRTAPVLLHRDYWDDEGRRHRQGSVINIEVATARNLIKEKKAERADPLPGEDG